MGKTRHGTGLGYTDGAVVGVGIWIVTLLWLFPETVGTLIAIAVAVWAWKRLNRG